MSLLHKEIMMDTHAQVVSALESGDVSVVESLFANWQPAGVAFVEFLHNLTDQLFRTHAAVVERGARMIQLNACEGAMWFKARVLEDLQEHAAAADVLDSFSPQLVGDYGEREAFRLYLLAKNQGAAGRQEQASLALTRAVRLTNSYKLLCRIAKLVRETERTGHVCCPHSSRIAILGNATFHQLTPVLKAGAFAFGIGIEIFEGGYNQQAQEILAPDSPLIAFRPDVVILATDWRWLGLVEVTADPDTEIMARLAELQRLWTACRERFGAFVIQHNFEIPENSAYGRLSTMLPGCRGHIIQRINRALSKAATKQPDVAVLDVEQLAGVFGKTQWNDPRLWIVAKQYPAREAIPSLTRAQVTIVRATLGLTSKCLVLDLDNTLWGGVIGEDGLDGIRLGGTPEGEAYVEFQRYVKALSTRGVILAVCSKNNEADAMMPFERHPEMVLKLSDISLFVANWRPKHENLRYIAVTLNIGIDSLVFIDDNPVERALVRKEIPAIEVPELSPDPVLFADCINRSQVFEALTVTSEDRLRTDSYRMNAGRDALRASSSNLDQYLSELNMEVELRPFDNVNMPRIVQLIGKTNQFNLVTRRLGEKEIKCYLNCPDHYTVFMHLRDRFGDSGITGVLMASRVEDDLAIDIWLLSCRVLSRRIEEAMLCAVWNFAQTSGFRALRGLYIPTEKNQQVANLYDRLGFSLRFEGSEGERHYRAELDGPREYPACLAVRDYTNREMRELAI